MRLALSIGVLFIFCIDAEGFSNGVPVAVARIPCKTRVQGNEALQSTRLSGRDDKPGSDLFPGKGPYVPSGLSQEEYSKIKKKEEAELAKMNFGAWGPRFKRTDRPDGDWMVMPSLWTNGFNAQPRGGDSASDASSGRCQRSLLVGAISFFRKRFPALLLSFIAVDSLTTAISMAKVEKLSAKQALLMILRAPTKGAITITIIPSAFRVLTFKFGAVALISPVMNRLLDFFNRRRLWSNRRTIGFGVASSLAFLSIWASSLILAADLL